MSKKSAYTTHFNRSKLIYLLAVFDGFEMKKLRAFLSTPTHYGGKVLLDLFDALALFHPKFVDARLTAEHLYAKVFHGEAFDHQKLKKRMSDLVRLTYQFMAHEAIAENPYIEQQLIASYLGRRNFDRLENYVGLQRKKMETEDERGAAWFRHFYQLSNMVYHHPEFEKLPPKGIDLSGVSQSLDKWFALEKLMQVSEAIDMQRFTQHKAEVQMLNVAEEWLEREQPNEPIFLVLEKTLLLLKAGEEEYFKSAKSAYLTHYDRIAPTECSIIFQLLLNHSARQYRNISSEQWLMEVFELLQFGLRKGLLVFNGKMREGTFTNISNTSVLAGNYKWADDFIAKYQDHLDENIRRDVVSLALAFLHFHQKEFGIAYDKLMPPKSFVSLRHRLVARPLIVRCLFEMQLRDENYSSLFISELKSFEKFIRSNKSMNINHKIPYLHFIKILRQVANGIIQQVTDAGYWEKIISFLEKEPVMAKIWMLQRLEELKTQKR
jgi:hypothetical protein